MLNLLISIIGLVITILIIVGFHEFGHFIVARMAGVKVLRFSIGFGKSLFSWHDKSGTEYVLAAIPLGGYVKMLDENEAAVAENEIHRAYNRQALYKKFLIVVAGPLANLILAFFLYWLLFVVGFTSMAPIIGKVTPHSIAANAGIKSQQEIVSIDQKPIISWMSASIRILFHSGDNDTLTIVTKNPTNQTTQTHLLNLTDWHLDNLKPDPIGSLGLVPYEPEIPAVIGELRANSPASQANLKIGDKIIAINNQPIHDWIDLSEAIEKHAGQKLLFTIQRNKHTEKLSVTIGSEKDLFAKAHGFLGISPQFEWPKNLLRENKYSVLDALPHAWRNTYDFTYLNFMVIGKLFEGKVSLQSLGGPISIFQGAGSALHEGITPFIGFLAFISISIGIINIFPIPGLDGGHVLFQLIEFIIRRPIPERVQSLFYRFGLILLLLLICQAVFNDILRLT